MAVQVESELFGNMAAKLNLLILQGSSFRKILSFRHEVFCKAKLSPTQLEVRPLVVPLAAGVELQAAGDLLLVVASAAARGDRSLQISPYDARIPRDTVFAATPVDLTGVAFRATIRTGYGKPSIAELSCNTVSATEGAMQISLPAMITEGIKPNARWEDLPSDLQDREAFESDVYSASYVWDLESVVGIEVIREVEGRVFVTPEATRP